jgi:hypothetical protein
MTGHWGKLHLRTTPSARIQSLLLKTTWTQPVSAAGFSRAMSKNPVFARDFAPFHCNPLRGLSLAVVRFGIWHKAS